MLVAVADSGSFIAGAELVHRSPSALSMQIKALEAALGKPLFIRNTRNLALTPDGHTLLGYARQMLALRDEAWAEMVLPGSQGRVRIGMPDDYASSLLPPVLRTFSATYPRVEIQVVGRPSHELALQIKDNTLTWPASPEPEAAPASSSAWNPWYGLDRQQTGQYGCGRCPSRCLLKAASPVTTPSRLCKGLASLIACRTKAQAFKAW
jgi:DNA-binding transcriptional LysR family regulator